MKKTVKIQYFLHIRSKSIQQDAISKFLDLDCHDIRTCELHARVKGLQVFQHM
jgi:hypothetical protein